MVSAWQRPRLPQVTCSDIAMTSWVLVMWARGADGTAYPYSFQILWPLNSSRSRKTSARFLEVQGTSCLNLSTVMPEAKDITPDPRYRNKSLVMDDRPCMTAWQHAAAEAQQLLPFCHHRPTRCSIIHCNFTSRRGRAMEGSESSGQHPVWPNSKGVELALQSRCMCWSQGGVDANFVTSLTIVLPQRRRSRACTSTLSCEAGRHGRLARQVGFHLSN